MYIYLCTGQTCMVVGTLGLACDTNLLQEARRK